MRLKRLQITDFLSVRRTIDIDFDKNVTIFLGSNDHGKTNILNSLLHLNDDAPITEDDRNWDATDIPVISYEFTLDNFERQEWHALILKIREEATSKVSAIEEEAPVVGEDEEKSADSSASTGAKEVATVSEEAEESESLPKEPGASYEISSLNPDAETVVLSRRGVKAGFDLAGIPMDALPTEVVKFISKRKPRVELFQRTGGNLQDSTNGDQIKTAEYEFLQGVFFYAGLDPMTSDQLFTQNDVTVRALANASEQLDNSLRSLWGQGTELHFQLQHEEGTIQFFMNDPAIKKRVARMSKRSEGVTHFFRISMILHARREKNPAESYIFLFDEPGIFLHPQGQRDLIQALEQLSDENQIVYATHSLFMLNQNFPERHRLIYKDEEGTKVDQKPYRQNWRLATDALGVYLSSNILFSSKVLLSEGDSDPIYIYELFRQLNRGGFTDFDINPLGIMSFENLPNLRYLLQVFAKEGKLNKVVLLVDGDDQGAIILDKTKELCKQLSIQTMRLPDGRSTEDLCLYPDLFIEAVGTALRIGLEAEGKKVLPDLAERIKQSWEEFNKKGPNGTAKRTTGRWFKDLSALIVGDDVSKVGLARHYTELCRDRADLIPPRERLSEAKRVCEDIASRLGLQSVRAKKVIAHPSRQQVSRS